MSEIVIRAAIERNRKRKGGGLPRKKARKGRMPTREEYILIGTQTFGQDAEALGREYDAAMMGQHGEGT